MAEELNGHRVHSHDVVTSACASALGYYEGLPPISPGQLHLILAIASICTWIDPEESGMNCATRKNIPTTPVKPTLSTWRL